VIIQTLYGLYESAQFHFSNSFQVHRFQHIVFLLQDNLYYYCCIMVDVVSSRLSGTHHFYNNLHMFESTKKLCIFVEDPF